MSDRTKQAWARAETISATRLMTVTEIAGGEAFVARFAGDKELRGFGQNLINYGDGTFGLLILGDGSIPLEPEAQRVLMPDFPQQEEITATVQMIYSCSASASLHSQGYSIHQDLTRLLTHDRGAEAGCTGFTIQRLAPEAETYGNIEPSNVPAIQSDRMRFALSGLYIDADTAAEQLRSALCDLRHFADANDLNFDIWNSIAADHYSAEKAA